VRGQGASSRNSGRGSASGMGAAAAAGKQDYARQRRKLGSLFSWKFDRNPLICYGGFCIQLGKKPSKINAIILTLNQRVAGSSPAAPTIHMTEMYMIFGPAGAFGRNKRRPNKRIISGPSDQACGI
jgi:hypothetical protein